MTVAFNNGCTAVGSLNMKFYELRNCVLIDPIKNKDMKFLMKDLGKYKVMIHSLTDLYVSEKEIIVVAMMKKINVHPFEESKNGNHLFLVKITEDEIKYQPLIQAG